MDEVKKWRPENDPLWFHLNYTGHFAKEWLYNESGIDPVIVGALTAEETRPRSLVHKGGMLIIMRGVNLNPGTDPEDMVSIRFWIESNLIVILRNRRVLAIESLRQALEQRRGPSNPGEFLEHLSNRLVLMMGIIISDLEDSVDELEDEILTDQSNELRQKIANIRRTAIGIRLYLAPQRDVMAHLHNEKLGWLDERACMRLMEIADRTTRYVENLDAIRDHAAVTQEELNSRIAEQTSKTIYCLVNNHGHIPPPRIFDRITRY